MLSCAQFSAVLRLRGACGGKMESFIAEKGAFLVAGCPGADG